MSSILEIPLTKGKTCIADASDAEAILKHSWRSYCSNRGRWYAQATIKQDGRYRNIFFHRYLLGVTDQKLEVDHINGDGLDNRRSNLRTVTRAQNIANARKTVRPTTSKYKGVCWVEERKRWYAQLRFQGKGRRIGAFRNEVAAALAYDLAALEVNGEHACTNFPAQLLLAIKQAGIRPGTIDQMPAIAPHGLPLKDFE